MKACRDALPLGLVALALCSGEASAHLLAGEAGGFLSGFEHPAAGLDHVLAMVSVGIWGAQLGAPALWLLPVMFPMVMALGGFLGLVGVPLPGVEVGIALSALVLGMAILLQWRPPLAAALFVVCIFAIFHGHAHGTELPPGESGLLYSMGFVIATGCLHLLGITAGTSASLGMGRARFAGSRSSRCVGRPVLSLACGSMILPPPKAACRVTLLAAAVLLVGTRSAGAHLVTTGLGPLYDGAAHFFLSPEDLMPVLALALLGGMRGPKPARWMLFMLSACWLAGNAVGWYAGTPAGNLLPAFAFIVAGGLVALDAALPAAVASRSRRSRRSGSGSRLRLGAGCRRRVLAGVGRQHCCGLRHIRARGRAGPAAPLPGGADGRAGLGQLDRGRRRSVARLDTAARQHAAAADLIGELHVMIDADHAMTRYGRTGRSYLEPYLAAQPTNDCPDIRCRI